MSLEGNMKKFKVWIMTLITNNIKNHGHGGLKNDGSLQVSSGPPYQNGIVVGDTASQSIALSQNASSNYIICGSRQLSQIISSSSSEMSFGGALNYDYNSSQKLFYGSSATAGNEIAKKSDLSSFITSNDISGKADSSDFDTMEITLEYTDGSPDETVEIYIVSKS